MIVGIILLIAAFGILLFVYLKLNPSGEINREVCHNSAVLKMTLPESKLVDTKEVIPLKCETRKVCITDKTFGNGDCSSELGEKYDTVRVSKDKTKQEKEIKMFVAREMADCWAMMGEGKGQIFSRELTTRKTCAVCTRISFDKSIKEKTKEITGLGKYLTSYKVPNKEISYWDFLSSGMNVEKYDETLDKFSTNQKAIVFMEVGGSTAYSWISGILGGTGGAIVGAKLGALVGPTLGAIVGSVVIPIPGVGTAVGAAVGGGVVGFIGGAVVGGIAGSEFNDRFQGAEYASANFFLDYDKSKISGLECTSFENLA